MSDEPKKFKRVMSALVQKLELKVHYIGDTDRVLAELLADGVCVDTLFLAPGCRVLFEAPRDGEMIKCEDWSESKLREYMK